MTMVVEVQRVKLREPNLFIESKTQMNRWELVLWLYAIRSVRVDGDLEDFKREKKFFSAYAIIDLRRLAEYVASLRKTEGEGLTSKDVLDYSNYFRQILQNMVKKNVFEIQYEKYKKILESLGYGYWLELLPKEIDKSSPIITAVIESIYKLENGKLRIDFTDLVAPLIVEYKKWYSTYRLSEVLRLKSRFSLILYRLFREKLGLKINTFQVEIERLKELLGVKLRNFQIFSKILKPAIEEINQKTSLKVKIKPIRKGRGGKIVGFEFRIAEKGKNPKLEELLNDKKALNEWINSVLNELSKNLETTKEELAEFLLSLRRVKTATALWFLLHFPKGARAYALRHLEITDNSPDIKFPDKFLEKLLIEKKEELNFLKDERIEPLLNKALEEMLKGKEVKENPQPQTSETLDEEDEELKEMLGL